MATTLGAIVGADHVLTATAACAAYLVDERGLYDGRALAVVRPADCAETAAVVTACAAAGVGMVAQGGNTGYCGGATPGAGGDDEVVISLERLDRVRDLDRVGATITVEAGVTLAAVQSAAEAAGLLFPLAMGSQASCRIGGNLSTNAGGLAVLRYGMARDLTLGLEVVLPDGRVLDLLRALRKDNTGYDLKQLFIGAEGTLGIITAATLKLYPRPTQQLTVLATVGSPARALDLLGALRGAVGDAVTSFEYLASDALARLGEAFPDAPWPRPRAPCVLAECSGFGADDTPLLTAVSAALEGLGLADVDLARSEQQRRTLWRMREQVPAAERHLGGSVKHDVTLPLAGLPEFLVQARDAVLARWPGSRLSVYGHFGDGNVHFNVLAPADHDPAAFRREHAAAITTLVHDLAEGARGSFSAEHGIGQLKRHDLEHYRGGAEIDLMRTLKRALDPRGLMNPGKLC
ncbi:MAG: FAD-binding oxidoreductase [Gammaproteobacteria bacterium]|nr:FAD-binding oxidoreductase [Gammaproteobacteria bacterium]